MWLTELNDQAQELSGSLNTFARRLTADMNEDAVEDSDTVHDAEA